MTQAQLRLAASPRSLLGKKVRHLRREGLVPGNISGGGGPSTPIQIDARDLEALMSRVGTNALVTLTLDGAERSVLIRGVARDARRGDPIHVDLQEVSLDQPIKAIVPVVLVGEAPAAKGDNILLRLVDHLTVEALPATLPPSIAVDVSVLEDADQTLHVRDLVLPEGVRVLDDPDEPVVKVSVSAAAREEVAEEAAAEAAESAEEVQPAGEGEESGQSG